MDPAVVPVAVPVAVLVVHPVHLRVVAAPAVVHPVVLVAQMYRLIVVLVRLIAALPLDADGEGKPKNITKVFFFIDLSCSNLTECVCYIASCYLIFAILV